MPTVPDLGSPSPKTERTLIQQQAPDIEVDRTTLHPGYVSGLWYGVGHMSSPIGTQAIAADTLYAQPTPILFPCTIAELGIVVGTQGIGLAKLGIYANGADGRPGALIDECPAAVDLNVVANAPLNTALSTPKLVQPGLYWLASVFNAITGVPFTGQFNSVLAGGFSYYVGSPTMAGVARGGSSPYSRLTQALTYGTPMPAQFGVGTLATNAPGTPVVGFKVA